MTSSSLAVYTPERQREVVELMGFKGTPQHTALLFQLAEHYQLDPLTKEISLIPGKGPFIGVWGRIHIGQRSGMLDGFEADDEWETDAGLYCVRCIVWRKDMGHPAAKVIGRVNKTERKDWPWEIARARAVRAGFGYAFNIHDAYDTGDESDWVPAPDERIQASVVTSAPDEGRNGETTAAPKRARKVNKKTGEVIDVPGPPEQTTSGAEACSPAGPPPSDTPEPPTVLVGGHTPAQKIAMAARNAAIDDDETRHDVIKAATGGAAKRGQEVQPDQYDRVISAFDGLADGTVELRYDPDGTPKLYKVKR